MPRLSEVIAALDALWPPGRAEGWDAVGTVCGDPDAEIDRVLFAVDPVHEIADEALELGAQLIVTHHPLYLRGTTTVAADTFKGKVVHTLIKHDIALHVAHTNADTADPGVSDALAGALDLRVTRPLVPDPPEALVRTVAVSGGSGDSLFDAVRAAGVDAFLTADLRHHPASEAVQHSPLGLVDAAHWATEWPWCEQAAAQLDALSDRHGWDLRVHVSKQVTDPWTTHHSSGAPN
ncbi:Nif3-like dinuclear metal center hexameric protein [Streptomyces sp. MBT54]|uniref:Nif3-like dinuclear metal center hexameric protein n=1 Tax=Streptomyces sp. MBT54 TaxID=1488385 RepID=UPI00190C79DE|nr:Nif3-like dinuclear metal center hexameric protein [Streptomyces sp. MBT54]MBK3606072.1 Nif3-like dinuclear metal center hexameric protein [Streptomyces sp. MBT54]